MNHEHVPQELLSTFVEGDLDEALAVHIAEHLDTCPSCATRAATLEPLAAAFAAVPDPEPPEGLVEAALAEAERADRPPAFEIALGATLLAAAALLAVLAGDPVAAAARLGVLANALGTAGTHLHLAGSASLLGLTASTAAIGTLGVLTARSGFLQRRLS